MKNIRRTLVTCSIAVATAVAGVGAMSVTRSTVHAHGAREQVSGRRAPCPTAYPFRLAVVPDFEYEKPFVADIVACTNLLSTRVWLQNTGDAVWTISARGSTVDQQTMTSDATARRAAVRAVYRYAVLGPDTSVVVREASARTSFSPDLALSAVWWTHEVLTDTMQDFSLELATHLLDPQSPVSRTAAKCAAAAVSSVGDIEDLLDWNERDVLERFTAAVGLTASGGSCAVEWARLADDVDEVPRWRTLIGSLGDDVDQLGRVGDGLQWFGHMDDLSRILKVVLR